METVKSGQNSLTAVIITACLIAGIISLDIFDDRTGIIILLAYLLSAMLFISGHFRLLMAGLSLGITCVIAVLMLAGDSMGVFTGQSATLIFILWLVILAFTLEYILVSGEQRLEKLPLYRQYLLLNMVQSLTLLFSSVILVLGHHLTADTGVPREIILNACTLLILFFFISFGLFTVFILKSMRSADFMSDFAKAVYEMGRDAEYEDRKQGIKQSGDAYDFLRTFRRIRFVTYLLFAASLAALFFLSKSRIIDIYAGEIYGRNIIIDFVIHVIKNPPPAVAFFLKAVFFVVDLIILKDLAGMIGGKRLKQWLKELYEPAQN